MGCIIKKLWVGGSKGEATLSVLFDSGASMSFIREDVAKKIADIFPEREPIQFKLGDGTSLTVRKGTAIQLNLKGHITALHPFRVVTNLPEELVIGADFMQIWKIKLDPVTEEFILDEKAFKLLFVIKKRGKI